MNNKLLIEEIKRVSEIMGTKVPNNLIVEAWQAALERLIIRMARYVPRVADNAAFVKLFDNKNLYKKFKDLFGEATNNKELIEAIEKNYDSLAAQTAIKRLLLQNRETREILLDIITNVGGKDGLYVYTNLDMMKLMLKELNEMGLPLTQKDFLKVTDDWFYRNVDNLQWMPWIKGFVEKNVIRLAIKRGSKLPKEIFYVAKVSSSLSHKGQVLSRLFKEYASTPTEVRNFLKTIDGMKAETANKIKLYLERGIPIDDPKLIADVWENILKHNSQSLQDEFIRQITRTKSMLQKILKGGANGKTMTPAELAKYLGLKETDELVMRILGEVSDPLFIRLMPGGSVVWKVLTAPFRFQRWVFWKPWTDVTIKTLAGKLWAMTYRFFFWYMIMPTTVLMQAAAEFPFLGGLLRMIEGDMDSELGAFQKVLSPQSDLQMEVNRKSSIAAFLENSPACDDPQKCSGEVSDVYYEAAKDIAIELGTYREIGVVPEEQECEEGYIWDPDKDKCVKLDTSREDWETGDNETGWYTGNIKEIEGWVGTWFCMFHKTDEVRIKKILKERGSMFGIAKIATIYYEKTGRNLWDDMELMQIQGHIVSDYYRKWIGWAGEEGDTTRDVILDIELPFYTYWDGNIVIIDVNKMKSKLRWDFPKQLDTIDGEIWKPCYGGRLPLYFQTYVEACDDGGCNSEGIKITKESDMSKLLAEDFNTLARQVLDIDYDLYNRPLVTDSQTGAETYSPKGKIAYACSGKSRPTDWDSEVDEAKNKLEQLSEKYSKNRTNEARERIIGLARVLKN